MQVVQRFETAVFAEEVVCQIQFNQTVQFLDSCVCVCVCVHRVVPDRKSNMPSTWLDNQIYTRENLTR